MGFLSACYRSTCAFHVGIYTYFLAQRCEPISSHPRRAWVYPRFSLPRLASGPQSAATTHGSPAVIPEVLFNLI